MSKGLDHLMNRKDFEEFTNTMWNEMTKHKDEKMSLKYMRPENVFSVCMLELKNRLADIKMLEPEKIKKQDVHMANYLFFMWVKMKELLKEK